MSKKIKFGIVGLGHIGVRHVNCIIDNNMSDLVAVFDILPKNDWRKRHHTINFCSSFDELISQDLDVINICTPNYLHAEMAIKSLRAGKHVVVEKPMALSTEQAQKIIDCANSCKKSVFGVMQNRFSPTIIWLKKVISDGLLGQINLLSVNCFWNRNQNYYMNSNWRGSKIKDGGPLFTQFSHFVDIINWIFGDFSNISAEFYTFNKRTYVDFEDTGIVNFNLKNTIADTQPIRAILTYSTSVWDKNFESSITLIGQYGTVKIGGQYMDRIAYCDIKGYEAPVLNTTIQCNDYGDYQGSASNHDKMLSHVVETLNSLYQTNDIYTSSDGVDVVNIIERIYSSRN